MKKALFLLLMIPIQAFSKCDTGAIHFVQESGFGLSFGSESQSQFEQSQSINVPMTIDGKAACYKKFTKFDVKYAKTEKNAFVKVVVTPMKAEFENIPDSHVKQYLFVEKHPTNPALIKFHTMSFICSGDIPLSVEAFSDRYIDVMMKANEVEVQVSGFFATGVAAQNLNKGKEGRSNNQETFDLYTKLYEKKAERTLEQAPKCNYNIPSIISETSVQVMADIHRKIASNYTTMGAKVVNGCTKDFSQTMKEYLFENYEQNETLSSFKVKKKFNGSLIITADK